MGGFGCPICSDRLDRLPAESAQRKAGQDQGQDVNISATPCGHIFHTYCINKWLTGNQGANKQCPCCRKPVANLRVLPLFPTGSDDSILDDSISGSCDHSNFNITISSLRKKLEEEQEKYKEAEVMLDVQRDSAEDYKRKYNNEKQKSDHYLFQWKQYESYKDYANEKAKRVEELEAEIKKFQLVESLLKGTSSSEVDEQLRSFPPTAESVKTLIEMQQVLTREVQSTSKKLDETKKDQEALRMEKMQLRGRYEKLLKDHNELRKVYENSVSFNSTPQSARRDVKDIQYSTRTPLLMTSKITSRKKLNAISSDEEEIDEDVAVLQPFGIGTKRTHTKANNVTKSSSRPKTDFFTENSLSGGSLHETTDLATRKGLKKKPPVVKDIPSAAGSESAAKKCKRETEITIKPSTSTAITSNLSKAASTMKKISKLTNCDLSPIGSNRTIELSSDDDDMFSPMPLRGNVPGVKVTPLNRAAGSSKLLKKKPQLLKKSTSSSSTLEPSFASKLIKRGMRKQT